MVDDDTMVDEDTSVAPDEPERQVRSRYDVDFDGDIDQEDIELVIDNYGEVTSEEEEETEEEEEEEEQPAESAPLWLMRPH